MDDSVIVEERQGPDEGEDRSMMPSSLVIRIRGIMCRARVYRNRRVSEAGGDQAVTCRLGLSQQSQ